MGWLPEQEGENAMRPTSATTTATHTPAPDYSSAMAQFAALQAQDSADVNPVCHSRALTHGETTDRVVVLLHGMTNCPRQFHAFAPLLYERGYNVLIPRETRNGLLDRDTTALSELTVAELTTFSDRIADIAHGLGRRVTVVGISAGGVMAAWLAQFRNDLDAVVVIAPSFGILPELPRLVNAPANRAVIGILNVLPNLMTQRIRPFTAGPPQGYRGFASRGLAAIMQMGQFVFKAARNAPPATHHVLMVSNQNDNTVNVGMINDLATLWRRHGAPITTFEFAAKEMLGHDLIDPEQPNQRASYVYPILLDLIDRVDAPPPPPTS